MSKLETPLTHRYWKQVGGTLLEEYRVGRRLLDAIIIAGGEHRIASRSEHISLDGLDVIAVETKGKRLNRYLAGQAGTARHLIEKYLRRNRSAWSRSARSMTTICARGSRVTT